MTHLANGLRRGCCRFRVGTSHRLVVGKQPGDASLGPVTLAAVVGGLKVSRLPRFFLQPRPPPFLPCNCTYVQERSRTRVCCHPAQST